MHVQLSHITSHIHNLRGPVPLLRGSPDRVLHLGVGGRGPLARAEQGDDSRAETRTVLQLEPHRAAVARVPPVDADVELVPGDAVGNPAEVYAPDEAPDSERIHLLGERNVRVNHGSPCRPELELRHSHVDDVPPPLGDSLVYRVARTQTPKDDVERVGQSAPDVRVDDHLGHQRSEL
eukprot:235747-Hanusia_phi.AAC.2